MAAGRGPAEKLLFLGFDAARWLGDALPLHDWNVVERPRPGWLQALQAPEHYTHVVLRSPFLLDVDLAGALPNLQKVLRAGVGMDGVDLSLAHARGIKVERTNAPGTPVAELAVAHWLALRRHLHRAHDGVVAGRWEKHSLVGDAVFGTDVLIVGFGSIGQAIARLLTGFQVRTVGVDRNPSRPDKRARAAAFGVELTSNLDAAVRRADAIFLACPLNPETHHLIGRDRLKSLRCGAVLVNVGRGDLVDVHAIDVALRTGELGGYAADVHPGEPTPVLPDSTANVSFTPHIGSQTEFTQRAIASEVLAFVREALGISR